MKATTLVSLKMFLLTALLGAAAAEEVNSPAPAVGPDPQAFHLIVMDPLAAPLSCPCVEGYAQRDYNALASHLRSELKRKVHVTFDASLAGALKKSGGRADLIIGKDSVVRADALEAKMQVQAIAALTDQEGQVTQQGLVLVRNDDQAKTIADLQGYEVYFGPAECDEKHSAAIALFRTSGVEPPQKLLIDFSCSDGACKVVEFGENRPVAAVISSYARPLLEGCGTIKKGELRVVGKTAPVPFITAFATSSLSAAESASLRESLLNATLNLELMQKLESQAGFVELLKKKN